MQSGTSTPGRSVGLPFYYGWVQVCIAALAMVATLPGRTQGLGLITEPILQELHVTRLNFSLMNFWATLLGAALCFPCGRLIDRVGSRAVMVGVLLCLGSVVVGMSMVAGAVALFVSILLLRGLGQSALSVVSLALVGKWFSRRISAAMGVYSVLVGLGFVAAFATVGHLLETSGWRATWLAVGLSVLAAAVLALMLARKTPEACGMAVDGHAEPHNGPTAPLSGATVGQALQSPAFWVFGISSAMYALVAAGITLFNESILEERGFDAATYHTVLVVSTFVGLGTNLLGGWLAQRWPIGRLMAVTMLILMISILALTGLRTQAQVYAYAVTFGGAGGVVVVIFFAVWGQAFGRAYLGQIQGLAQMLTVGASALGPVLFATCKDATGSYSLLLYGLAPVMALLGVWAWLVPVPSSGEDRLPALATVS